MCKRSWQQSPSPWRVRPLISSVRMTLTLKIFVTSYQRSLFFLRSHSCHELLCFIHFPISCYIQRCLSPAGGMAPVCRSVPHECPIRVVALIRGVWRHKPSVGAHSAVESTRRLTLNRSSCLPTIAALADSGNIYFFSNANLFAAFYGSINNLAVDYVGIWFRQFRKRCLSSLRLWRGRKRPKHVVRVVGSSCCSVCSFDKCVRCERW